MFSGACLHLKYIAYLCSDWILQLQSCRYLFDEFFQFESYLYSTFYAVYPEVIFLCCLKILLHILVFYLHEGYLVEIYLQVS